jgi:hypothetical protein
MIVEAYGIRSGRSPSQSKNGFTTTPCTMCGAESSSLTASGSSKR